MLAIPAAPEVVPQVEASVTRLHENVAHRCRVLGLTMVQSW
jgi:hypothetical protein